MSDPQREILVVDDDDDVRDAISLALTEEGYRVSTKCDGLEALEYLREAERPALILLDMMMPRMDGAELCARLAEDATLSSIPVVIVTAGAWAERRPKAPSQVRGVLKKPVTLERLLEVVEKICVRE